MSVFGPIFFLCFSKILESIMHNSLHQYLNDEKILYTKQFGFQAGHSTGHALVKVSGQIQINCLIKFCF